LKSGPSVYPETGLKVYATDKKFNFVPQSLGTHFRLHEFCHLILVALRSLILKMASVCEDQV